MFISLLQNVCLFICLKNILIRFNSLGRCHEYNISRYFLNPQNRHLSQSFVISYPQLCNNSPPASGSHLVEFPHAHDSTRRERYLSGLQLHEVPGDVLISQNWAMLAPSLKLTACPWKWWFPIGISSSRGLFSGDMLVSGGVLPITWLLGAWTNPIWNIWSSNWIMKPQVSRGEHKKYLSCHHLGD